jgi:hypothetical protein
MTDTPKYIYRQGSRVKDLALTRNIDFLTGLSFYDEPVGKLNVQTLIQNGFHVRSDGETLVKQLFTDATYIEPNSDESMYFPEGHVAVWHPTPEYWQKWYDNDKLNHGKVDISEQLAFFALAIEKEDKS